MGNFSNYWDLTTLFTKIKNKLKSISDKIDDSVSLKTATGNPITLTDAANTNAEKLVMTIEPVQDLHGYSKPWPAGGGKNKCNATTITTGCAADGIVSEKIGEITLTETTSILLSFEQNKTIGSVQRNTLVLRVPNTTTDYYPTNVVQPGLNAGYHEGLIENMPAGTYDVRMWLQKPDIAVSVTNFMIRDASISDNTFEPYSNICPISGLTSGEVTRTGFNIWNEEWEVGDIAFATGMNISSSSYFRNKGYIPVIPNMAYYYCTEESSSTFLFFYDENYTYLGQTTGGLRRVEKNSIFTTPNCAFMRFAKQTTTYNNDICINISDPDKNGTYEPYTAANATITFGQTVYGGSVNFKTGEVTVTHGMADLGTLEWYKQNTASSNWRFYADLDLFRHADVGELCGFLCSTYREVTAGQTWQGIKGVSGNGLTSNSICVCDMTYTDAATFKTAMSGVQLCYELETPTTLTLTPAELELLKGNNTITANGAEISLSYYPDNAIGTLAGRVEALEGGVDALETDKADITDVNTALAGKADVTTVTIPRFITSQAGWRRICKIKPVDLQTVEGMIYVGGFWSNGQQPSATVAVSIMNSTASLTLLSSAFLGTKRITAMRLVADTEIEFWLDVYFPAYSSLPGPFKLKFTGDIAVSDIQDPISITTDATAASDEISLNQKVSGTVLTDKSGATKTYVDDLIKTEYVSSVISSMTGNSNTTVSIPLTIPNGYVAIGCLQTLTSTRSVAITGAFINAANSTLKMNCVNLYSDALSNVTVGATVAYIRS